MSTKPSLLLACFLALGISSTLLATEIDSQLERTNAQEIVNGTASEAGMQPWMAALIYDSPLSVPNSVRQFCTGALIAPEWVLTAAHCVEGVSGSGFKIWLQDLNLDDEAGELLQVAQTIVHPFFGENDFLYDIALIRLAEPSSNETIALPDLEIESELYGTELTAYGWGAIASDQKKDCTISISEDVTEQEDFSCNTFVFQPGVRASTLMQTNLTLHTEIECEERAREYLSSLGFDFDFESDESYVPLTLCLWDDEDLSSACYGDSGGPVVAAVDGQEFIVGVASVLLVSDCMPQGQIIQYSRVATLLWFIEEYTGSVQEMSFKELCPSYPNPIVSFEAAGTNKKKVTIDWDDVDEAAGYTLFYSAYPIKKGFVGKLKLPSSKSEYSIVLKTGAQYFIAAQTRGMNCDSGMSALQAVVVP